RCSGASRARRGGGGAARSGDRPGLARERGEGFGRLGAGGAPATPRPGAERIDPKRRRPVRTSAEGRVDVGSAGHLSLGTHGPSGVACGIVRPTAVGGTESARRSWEA